MAQERVVLWGGSLPPNASASTSGMSLRTLMQELHAEPAGRKSEYISPAVSPPNAGAGPWEARKGISVGGAAMLMPLRASQAGRRSSLPSISLHGMAPGRRSSLPPQGMELVAPHTSHQTFSNRLPSERAVTFGSVSAFPVEGASVARARSLESNLGWASHHEYSRRREVAVPERPAGSLKPLRERRNSLGSSRPLGFLRKSTRADFAVRAPSDAAVHFVTGLPAVRPSCLARATQPPGRCERKQTRVVRTSRKMDDGPCAQELQGGPRVEPPRQVGPHCNLAIAHK